MKFEVQTVTEYKEDGMDPPLRQQQPSPRSSPLHLFKWPLFLTLTCTILSLVILEPLVRSAVQEADSGIDDALFSTQQKSLAFGHHEMEFLCNQTNDIVTAVRNRALFNEKEALLWKQSGPFSLLTCEQLIRSLPTTSMKNGRNATNDGTTSSFGGDRLFELANLISLQRLAEKLSKLEEHPPHSQPSLTIAVIGGSMSTGWVDVSKLNNDTYNLAFPKKLEQFLQHKWPTSSMKVINLAIGGADENTWLGRLDLVMELDPDVIIVESAVNDQCNYNAQDAKSKFVNETSFALLNLLTNFPQQPAVISVELFRTAMNSKRDANQHCRGHVQEVTSNQSRQCFYCPQWWNPQTWREEARAYNSVSQASYRDAVWPILDHPPEELCTKYWNGLSHPEAGVHAMVASTILFQFMAVMERKNVLVQLLSKRVEQQQQDGTDGLKIVDVPQNICLTHISSYRALQDDPNDPFGKNHNYRDSCWSFRADVRRKYGWICETYGNNTMQLPNNTSETTNVPSINRDEYLHLSKKIWIGEDRKIIISRLVSYNDRMAMAQVWFTSSNGTSPTNIFVGDPVWNISSWHEEKMSTPQPYAIQLDTLQFKGSLQMQWPAKCGTSAGYSAFSTRSGVGSSMVEVTFNLKMLAGASRSASVSGVHKFKLIGIVTC